MSYDISAGCGELRPFSKDNLTQSFSLLVSHTKNWLAEAKGSPRVTLGFSDYFTSLPIIHQ
jgi:hypothetical protein